MDDIETRLVTLIEGLSEVEGKALALQDDARRLRREYLVKTAPERVCPNCTEHTANEGDTFTPCEGPGE